MISLLLLVLEIVLWVWLFGFFFTIPVMVRHVFATEEEFTVGHLIIIPISALLWFLQIEDIVDELNDAFGIRLEQVWENIWNYRLFKIKNS